jgi:hypothetical protein
MMDFEGLVPFSEFSEGKVSLKLRQCDRPLPRKKKLFWASSYFFSMVTLNLWKSYCFPFYGRD